MAEPQTAPLGGFTPARPTPLATMGRWNRLYLLLAAISVLTVLTSITLTLRGMDLFHEAAEASQAWAQRLSLHAELNAILVCLVIILGCGAGFQVITVSRRLAEVSESQAELHRIKQSFEEASLARTKFLAQLSHDIRTPMVGIVGMTALALDTELTEEQRTYLAEVKSSANQLLDVIAESCDFPGVDSGAVDLDAIDFELQEVVGAAIAPLASRARDQGAELISYVGDDVPATLIGDPARLRQVLASVVSSALKFTERGEVVLRAQLDRQEDQNTWVRFTVQDTSGIIATESQQALVDALSGTEAVATSPAGRAGLSLAMGAQLVARMGGNLRMENATGEGNTFQFTLQFGTPLTSSRRTSPLVPANLKNLRVIVVDDNSTQCQVLGELLSQWRMRPTLVNSAAAALTVMLPAVKRQEPFPLALIDTNMPGMNGFDLALKVAAEPPLARAIVLMIDSANPSIDEDRCRDLGIAGWVVKPILQPDLLNALTMAVRLSTEFKHDSQPAPTIERPIARGLHILVVEDNPINQTVVMRLLQKRGGHAVEIAANGPDGLATLERDKFDLVLMDVQMPGMDGFELTRRIRQKEQSTGHHIPIVALTANAMKGDREKCLAAGMDGYIPKPIQPEELYSEIAAIAAAFPETAPLKQDAESP